MAESVALEALGMLAATLLRLLDSEEADDAEGDDEEGEADEADEVVAKGKGQAGKEAASSTAFSFGPDKRAVTKSVASELVLTALPVLVHLWPTATHVDGGGSAGPYLEDAALLLKLVLFHGGAHGGDSGADGGSKGAADDDDDEDGDAAPESGGEAAEVASKLLARGPWGPRQAAALQLCCLSFLRTMGSWVGTCELDFAATAWAVAVHLAARQDVLPTAGLSTAADVAAAGAADNGEAVAAMAHKAVAQEGRKALLALAARAFGDGDLAAVRATSLMLRRAMAAPRAGLSPAAWAEAPACGERSTRAANAAATAAATAVDQLEPPRSAWPAPAVGKACELACRALLDLRATSDDAADAKAVAMWALVAACLTAGGPGHAAAASALRTATATPAAAAATAMPVAATAAAAAAAAAVAKKGGDKSEPLIQLCQSFTEALKATATLREGGSGGGKKADEEGDEEGAESAVEVGYALAPGSRKALVLAAAHVADALSGGADCTAGLRRQVAALLDASFPHLVLLAEEAAEDAAEGGDAEEEDGEEGEGDEDDEEEDQEEDEEVRARSRV
jgi:hypothetical protein